MKGYQPLNTLKPVARGIWIVDGPEVSFMGVPFPTRMVVIRLKCGDVMLISPIECNQWLARDIGLLGRVRHLVSPNWIHYAGMPGWQAAFPDALAWASPGVRERAAKQGCEVRWDRDLGEVAEADWAAEVDQLIVHGSTVHEEVAFLHRESRTLILADLIENFEPHRLGWKMRWIARLGGVLDPDGKAPLDMRLTFRRGKRELRAAVEKMIAWEPQRVIIAHGRWYEREGVAELQRAFRWAF